MMKLFFSWSGELSKETARIFKIWLSEKIFDKEDLQIFFSDEDIELGEGWFNAIRANIKDADYSIVFINKHNTHAPWLNFEAGALAISETDRRTAAFYIGAGIEHFKSPLKQYQMFTLTKKKIKKLILEIREKGNIRSFNEKHADAIIDRNYDWLETQLQDAIDRHRTPIARNNFVIFPEQVNEVKPGRIFIGSPMASVKEETYEDLRKNIIQLKQVIANDCGMPDIYYPGEEICNGSQFDGQEKAIINDFKLLKESEHYIFVYPKKVTSSILMEIGYAIALSKNTIIFTLSRKSLPYMLQQADKAIHNVRIYEFSEFDDVINLVKRNGAAFFVR